MATKERRKQMINLTTQRMQIHFGCISAMSSCYIAAANSENFGEITKLFILKRKNTQNHKKIFKSKNCCINQIITQPLVMENYLKIITFKLCGFFHCLFVKI
eukprot:NODE_216_length_12483_cov_2.137516.p11 type:complete len:102 gc:universal NODE_216_length_12483_cov_2.137516:6678-6373(-)